MMGAAVGLPATSPCINCRLYHIASVRAVITPLPRTPRSPDSLICGLFPLLYVAA
ncbi:hypothetical protein C8R44DRAFT_890194 [Mycena epipterygia]|nr:hypothetical protein C8R44DRAFT_890194 [Mycena epipterygia]